MKKFSIAIISILIFFSFSTISIARWGIGVESIEPGYGYGYTPFIAFDLTPMLQLRLGCKYFSAPKTEENEGPDTITDIYVSGIYKFWKSDFSPYLGIKIGIYNSLANMEYRSIYTYADLLLGVEWSIYKNISLYINTDFVSTYTRVDKDGVIISAQTEGIGNEFYLGAVLYLQ